MWYLQNVRDASFRLPLPPGRDLIVGRKDCDLLIPDDKSISRKHALLHLNNNSRTSPIFLTDCKSKFGTTLGERRLSSGEKVEIGVGDVVKFGQSPSSSKFKVIFEPIVVCCSSMSAGDKQKVKQLAKDLGGRLVGNWTSDCSHLVMSSLTVTVKVVCALACCKPVVTVGWLEEAVRHFRDNRMLPCTAQYLPPIVDEEVKKSEVSFAPNSVRASLFLDRVFYFFSKDQMATLHSCLTSAGARCVLIDKPDSVAMETLIVKESIVISPKDGTGSDSEREWAGQVSDFLDSHSLRAIPECEVGFALLHVSIDTYCNPRSKGGFDDANTSLIPPSLSQMPNTQSTQSQAYGYTQSQAGPPPTPIPSLSGTTILAPNSELSTQLSTAATAGHNGGTQSEGSVKLTGSARLKSGKVPETPSSGRSTASAQSTDKEDSIRVKTEPGSRAASKSGQSQKITDFVKPTRPASARGSATVSRPPAKRVKTERELENEQGDSDEPIEDSQPDSQKSAKKLPRLSLRKSPFKKPSIVYQSQEDILAKQSLESNQSVPDVSVLAPNSLTPGSTQKKGSGKSPLPGASFMTGLFGGSQKKKRKVEEIETESGEDQPKKPRKESQANDIHDRSNKRSDQIPKLELLEDSPEREGSTKGPVREENGSDSDSEVRSKVPRLASDSRLTQGPGATSTQATGPRTPRKRTKVGVSPIVSTTPFISTRKRRKNETELDTSKIPAMSFSEAADHNASLFSNTQATQDLLTPFTKLASSNRVAAPASIFTTTGKRSKVNPQTEADILWLEEEDRGEGEHPLGIQFEDPPSGKRYKPVLSEDGFIKARVKPKLEAPRVGRFAKMANSEYLRGDSPTSDSGGEGVASPDCHTQLHYQVEVVSLVTVGSGRRRVREDVNDVDDQNGPVKNFKKFRKVHNAGAGGVPRFLALTRYVPPSTSNMADWTIVDEPEPNARQSSEREEESQDSQNIFSLSKVRRKRTK